MRRTSPQAAGFYTRPPRLPAGQALPSASAPIAPVSERAARWRRPFRGAADRSISVRSLRRRLATWAEHAPTRRSVVGLLVVALVFAVLVQRGTGLGMDS